MIYRGPNTAHGRGTASAVPAWRSGKSAMSVFAVAAGNTLSSLNPKDNPAINPVYPSNPEWAGSGGQSAVINAWCGGCYGDEVGELWLPLSGGHTDYAGNEPYKINMLADTPMWVMPRPPSGAIGNVLTTNDSQESTGVYSDGRPRAIHTYNKAVWVDGVGPAISVQGSTAFSGQSGRLDYLQIDRVTGESTRTVVASLAVGNASGLGACYDTSRHAVWVRGVSDGNFAKFDIASGTWQLVGLQLTSSGTHGLCYLAAHDVVVDICNYYTSKIGVVDCVTGTLTKPATTGSPAVALSGDMQPVWVESLGAIAVWNNDLANAHRITLLTPGANPRTDTWTISTLDFSIVDQPTAKADAGTYGRFFYSARLNGFGVINGTTQPIYFFALG